MKKGLFTASTAINVHNWLPKGVNEENIWQTKKTNWCFMCIVWMSCVIMVNMELLESISILLSSSRVKQQVSIFESRSNPPLGLVNYQLQNFFISLGIPEPLYRFQSVYLKGVHHQGIPDYLWLTFQFILVRNVDTLGCHSKTAK